MGRVVVEGWMDEGRGLGWRGLRLWNWPWVGRVDCGGGGGKSAVGLRALRACASLFVRNTSESFIPLVLAGIVKLCLCANIA